MKYNNIKDFLFDLEERMDELEASQARSTRREPVVNNTRMGSRNSKKPIRKNGLR